MLSDVGPCRLLQFRELTAEDQDKLWHWLHIALWDPPPAGLRPVEVLQTAGVRIYAEGWGRATDVGVVAQVDGQDAGACWLRLLPVGVGLASVDAETPQLGIALDQAFQRQGHGRLLMLHDYQGTASDREGEKLLNDVGASINALKPHDAEQRAMLQNAQQQFVKLSELRWLIVGTTRGTIPAPLVALVVACLMLVFASYAWRAPGSAVVIASFVAASLLLTAAIVLILDMHGPDGTDHPNESVFVEVDAPRRIVLEHLSASHHFVLTIAFEARGEQTLVGWRQLFDSAEHRQRIAAVVAAANEQNLGRLAAEVARVG